MISGEKIYKVSYHSMVVYFILINIIVLSVGITLFIGLKTLIIMLLLVNLAYSYTVLLRKRPIKIIINKSDLLITIENKKGLKKTIETYKIKDIKASFRHEAGAKGGKIKVFRLYYKERSIIKIIPDQTGWKEKELEEVFKIINEDMDIIGMDKA